MSSHWLRPCIMCSGAKGLSTCLIHFLPMVWVLFPVDLTPCGLYDIIYMINIGCGKGLLPDGTKLLPEPMWTNRQWIFCGIHLRTISKEKLKISPSLIWDSAGSISNRRRSGGLCYLGGSGHPNGGPKTYVYGFGSLRFSDAIWRQRP